jgi:hypothetical protein
MTAESKLIYRVVVLVTKRKVNKLPSPTLKQPFDVEYFLSVAFLFSQFFLQFIISSICFFLFSICMSKGTCPSEKGTALYMVTVK